MPPSGSRCRKKRCKAPTPSNTMLVAAARTPLVSKPDMGKDGAIWAIFRTAKNKAMLRDLASLFQRRFTKTTATTVTRLYICARRVHGKPPHMVKHREKFPSRTLKSQRLRISLRRRACRFPSTCPAISRPLQLPAPCGPAPRALPAADSSQWRWLLIRAPRGIFSESKEHLPAASTRASWRCLV